MAKVDDIPPPRRLPMLTPQGKNGGLQENHAVDIGEEANVVIEGNHKKSPEKYTMDLDVS